MDKFKIMTFNVRGLQDKRKRNKIWGNNESIFNHGASNARGTAILFTENSNCKVLRHFNDTTGRFQMVSIQNNDTKYLICNIYNPNTEAKQTIFLSKVNDTLKSFPEINEHHITLGGDFNMYY